MLKTGHHWITNHKITENNVEKIVIKLREFYLIFFKMRIADHSCYTQA
jgi:hypothetical protein